MKILTLENIGISFGNRKILNDVALKVEPGSIISITGQSGSGKTTLLGIIAGIVRPETGFVHFRDENIFKWNDLKISRYRNRKIGFVYQSFNLIPDLTALQNIAFPALINRVAGGIRENLEYLIEYLELKDIINQFPSSLSGGEKQRVAIARAAINWPEILLADEPTGNLDEKTGKKIFSLFKGLRDEKEMILIIATHDRNIIRNSDCHYRLDNGKLQKG